MTETMDKVTVESGKSFLCPHCQYPFNGTEEVGARVIRCLDKDCDMQFVLDVLAPEPHENIPLEDVRGILKEDTLVEKVAIYLWWNWCDSNKNTYDDRVESWQHVCDESKAAMRKRAREFLSLLPLNKIRELAEEINDDYHHAGFVQDASSKIIALCSELAEPKPRENVPLEDMCGILKPRDTLVETVAIYLWWNWIDSNKSLDEEKEEHWSYVREESKVVTRKRARELLSKLPLDEIRGLAKGIERDNHHGGIVKSHAREIIALCGEPSEPDTMWDEINTVIVDEFRKKFSDQWCTGYANELTDRIMAIIGKERGQDE